MLGNLLGDSQLVHVCRHEDFYTLMRDKVHELTGKMLTRDQVKHDVMVYVLNAKRINGHPIWMGSAVDEAFKALFPQAHSTLESNIRASAKKGQQLIATLQGMEAKVIFQSVLPAVQKISPVSFTVHDSVAAPFLLSEKVDSIMSQQLDKG